MQARGWDAVDVVFVTGDAYVDHPSFAMAILGRVLEREGYRVFEAPVDRFPDPTWRVIWGESVSASDYSVFIDATTGMLLEKMH